MLYLGLKNITSNRLATYGELGSGSGYSISTQVTNFTVTATSGTIVLLGDTSNNNVTITLANAIGNTSTVILKKIGSTSQLIINTYLGTQTIDGATSITITSSYESITLVSDGAQWLII